MCVPAGDQIPTMDHITSYHKTATFSFVLLSFLVSEFVNVLIAFMILKLCLYFFKSMKLSTKGLERVDFVKYTLC